ncbi:MAG: hypothetical protein GY856_03270 [bacterium]|nr:hypothetical protein [bacterium]
MTTIAIQAEDELVQALRQLAAAESRPIETIAREALLLYMRRAAARRKYSFIGIGHSGKSDLSTQVEEILEKSADRREGWSLPR